jgi:hypothetical protein
MILQIHHFLDKEELKEDNIQLILLFLNKGFQKITTSIKLFQTLEKIELEQQNNQYLNQCQYKIVLILIKLKELNFCKE